MEHLGLWGDIKLTMQIILRNLKHFLCIAFLLALPYALILFTYGPSLNSIRTVVASISLLYKLSSSRGQLAPPDLTPDEAGLISHGQQHQYPLSLVIIVNGVSIIISIVCTVVVAFSVCRACINKSLDLKGSLRGVRRSAMNLFLTVLLVVGLMLAVIVVGMLVMVIVAAGLKAVKANILVIPVAIILMMGVIGGQVYMAVAFSVASTVAILEEKKGWEAMRRSMYLIKGSKGVAIGLYFFYELLHVASLFVCVSGEASVVCGWVVGGIRFGLQALLALGSMVSYVVLYMSCKTAHAEPLETLLAANAQFGPRDLAGEYLDLETAAFATSIP